MDPVDPKHPVGQPGQGGREGRLYFGVVLKKSADQDKYRRRGKVVVQAVASVEWQRDGLRRGLPQVSQKRDEIGRRAQDVQQPPCLGRQLPASQPVPQQEIAQIPLHQWTEQMDVHRLGQIEYGLNGSGKQNDSHQQKELTPGAALCHSL